MFERLFKFSTINFAEGEIGLQAGQAAILFGGLLVVLLVGFAAVYAVTNIYTSDRRKAVSFGLRAVVLLLLCLPLFEPVLIMPSVVPDENFVAVLVDASESMNIPDGAFGERRRDDVRHLLLDEDGIMPGIEENFQVRYYTFGEEAERVDSVGYATFEEHGTNLSAALDRVLTDFRGLPLAGVVLLTDGGDNSTDVPLNKAEELRSLDVPLHVVGLGQEAFEQEREILDVTVSKGVEETTGAEIDAKVRSWAAEPGPVVFNLYRGAELVFSEPRVLKGEGKIDQLTFFYEPATEGAAEYTLELTKAAGERNDANNTLNLLIDTRKDTLRVLYFEGHPRRDFKFIKRALEDDKVVEFTSVARTGPGKLYRQGIKTADELAGGFPAAEADLYQFKAILFGDIEASSFSIEQLRLIEQFVRQRGGGFLMLGGRKSFAEGNYGNTPVADVLPVALDPSRQAVLPPDFSNPDLPVEEQGYRFLPTRDGLESPVLKLSSDGAANQRLWGEMPGLTSINYLGAVKPGALVLAEKPADDFGDREPLLVVQRYGKGRGAALATASTWRWQMQLQAEDMRHERFWRQLVRWLTASAPNRVNLSLPQHRYAPGGEVVMTVEVYDPGYRPLDGAVVQGTLTNPFGGVSEVPFRPSLAEPGTYTAAFSPRDEGVYQIQVTAQQDGEEVGSHAQSFLVRPSKKEYYDATLKKEFLQHLTQANRGYYYTPEEADVVPANLSSRRTSTSVYRAEVLWDLPLLFGLILLLLSVEWLYRRRKGLP